jgi:uncharacterized membrane protein YiaA
MIQWFSKFLDQASEFLAHRKGLLPLVGILFILLNLVIVLIWPASIFATANILLHLGLVVALFGLMLSWAL